MLFHMWIILDWSRQKLNAKSPSWDLDSSQMKMACHRGVEMDPNEKGEEDDFQDNLRAIQAYIGRHFPDLHATPGKMETCLYTVKKGA